MKYIASDYSHYLKLSTLEKNLLSPLELYKGLAIMAVSGHRSELESQLNPLYNELLEIRRKLYFGQLDGLQRKINTLNQSIENSTIGFQMESMPLIKGDMDLLSGLLATLKGNYELAGVKMKRAADYYFEANDQRRVYKALVNKSICVDNEVISYQAGSLQALSENCLREGYFDVVGNIYKSYALELLTVGNVPRSIEIAQMAQVQYQKECYFDDFLISKCVEAIGESLMQNWARAKNLFYELDNQMFRLHHKTKDFYLVLRSLLEGKKPEPSLGHPLARVPWKLLIIKKGSLKLKLIELLREAPSARSELIVKLWGDNATHESYNQRFHSLLKETRESTSQLIYFDGELYSIL